MIAEANTDYTSIAIDGNETPYAACANFSNGGKANVMKFDGTNWIIVGLPEFSTDKAKYLSIAIDASGTPYVVFEDYNNYGRATVMKYNEGSWETVGNADFSPSQACYTSIAMGKDGNPYVVYEDMANSSKATVMECEEDKEITSVDSLSNRTVANGTVEGNIGLPATVDVTLSDGTTTSAAVTWNNGSPAYEGNTARTYTFTGTITLPDGVDNPDNYTASVDVIVQAANGKTLPPSANDTTTPAAVTIEGTRNVGDTLTAQLKDADGNNYTTSAAVAYEWYRLDDSDSEFVNEIGTGRNYRLTGSDLKK